MIASSLTLRIALENYYLPFQRTMSDRTKQKLRHQMTRWEKHTDDPLISRITTETIEAFRDSCELVPLSNDTIETTVSDVTTILRYCCERHQLIDRIPHAGCKLKRTQKRKYVPPVSHLGLIYEQAHVCTWPRLTVPTKAFWQAWLVTSYFTGLRLEDMMQRILLSNFSDEMLVVDAHKSGKIHCFPMHPVFKRHLLTIAGGDERLFPVSKSPHLVRRELRKMCQAAGVPKIVPHALRRLACTMWDKAKYGAGRTLHGQTLGVADRYIVPMILSEAVEALEIPKEILTDDERDEKQMAETLMLQKFRRLNSGSRQAVLALAEKLT